MGLKGPKKIEKIPSMPHKNVANTDLSSMTKIIIFYVLHVISVNFTVRGMMPSLGRRWAPRVSGRGENPLLPHRSLTAPHVDDFPDRRRGAPREGTTAGGRRAREQGRKGDQRRRHILLLGAPARA
jgi:hypothetical protein